MKTKVVVVIMLVIALVACGNKEDPGESPESTKILAEISYENMEGTWIYQCDVGNLNHYTWISKSYIFADDFKLHVFADFDDLVFDRNLDIALKINIQNTPMEEWLYIRNDGRLAPEINMFDRSTIMNTYPEGYEYFGQTLEATVDWARLYTRLTVEFLQHYQQDRRDPEGCNKPNILTPQGQVA